VKACRDPETPCMGQENYNICTSLLDSGCPEDKIIYMEMCPVIVSCMVDLPARKPRNIEPSRNPTPAPASPTLVSTVLPTGICTVPKRATPRRPSECSKARNNAYEEAISLFRSEFNDCDCDSIGQFSIAAMEQLLEKKYKVDPKGNSRREGVKKCARDGVERYIIDAADACIGPDTCQEVGFLVTDLIITDFCELPVATRFNPQQLKQCAKEARKVCEEDLFGALIDFLKGGYDCPAKDQFGSAAEAKQFIADELSTQCKSGVEKLLFG